MRLGIRPSDVARLGVCGLRPAHALLVLERDRWLDRIGPRALNATLPNFPQQEYPVVDSEKVLPFGPFHRIITDACTSVG